MEQLTLDELQPVCLTSPFEQIFGVSKKMSANSRRHRWAQWLKLAREKNKEAAKMWIGVSDCCDTCDQRRGKCWCKLQELPCTVNPVLSFKFGMVGMACCGAYSGINEK